MSYVDEVLQKVAEKNPGEKEFQQAVKEVLDSLRPVIEANEEQYRKSARRNDSECPPLRSGHFQRRI